MNKRELEFITKENEEYGLKTLEPLYESGIIPREKKPYIIDYKKSTGPYMALSHQDGCRYLLDASSQIASLSLGFNATALFGVGHHYEAWTNDLSSENSKDIQNSFENFLKRKCAHDKVAVSYTNSGSESNETALLMAYNKRNNAKAKKVLAFEGSFHGRMLTSLFSTWNKTKREPFQIPGFESIFCSFPEMKDLTKNDTNYENLLTLIENSSLTQLDKNIENNLKQTSDPLLKSELTSLKEVHNQLKSNEVFAVIIEPMQCEGGDKYASNRFYNLLTLLCKAHQVEIIFDEVQTGFHMGRDFFWFKSFNMKDSQGIEIYPDYVTSAKKSQTGFVLSFSGEHKENQEINMTSIIRGFYQGLITDQQHENIIKIEQYVTEKLKQLEKSFKELSFPRARGLAFSIDCENNDQVMSFIKKRFDYGLLIYPAGDKTLRFRLNTAFKSEEIDYLFDSLHALSENIFNNKEVKPPKTIKTSLRSDSEMMYRWHEKLILAKKNGISSQKASEFITNNLSEFEVTLEIINKDNFKDYKDQIIEIENETYEPLRRTDISKFERVVQSKLHVAIGFIKNKKLIGICFGGLLSDFPDERAMRRVRYFNHPKSLYMLDTTIIKESQGANLGKLLKYSFELLAISQDAQYIYGRNRDVLAGTMLNTNISLGAIPEIYASEDYLDDLSNRDVYIYRSNLRWKVSDSPLNIKASGPLTKASLHDKFIKDNLSSIINKVCLSNFISKSYINATLEMTQTLPENLRYIFSSSGHSECMDKVYKSLFYKNREEGKNAHKVLTLGSHHFGENSMLAHSLSYPDAAHFPVTQLSDFSLKNFEKELDKEQYLAVFLDLSTVLRMDKDNNSNIEVDSFLKGIKSLCHKKNVYLVYDETINHLCHDNTWLSNQEQYSPDAMIIYLGGQMGVCALKEELRVSKPLMMISTWDGDEYSLCASMYAKNTLKKEELSIQNIDGIKIIRDNLIITNQDLPYSLKRLLPKSATYSLSKGEIKRLNEVIGDMK